MRSSVEVVSSDVKAEVEDSNSWMVEDKMQVKPTRRRWRGHVIDATQRVILSSLSLCILWSSNLLSSTQHASQSGTRG
jgi:hypothetical protein